MAYIPFTGDEMMRIAVMILTLLAAVPWMVGMELEISDSQGNFGFSVIELGGKGRKVSYVIPYANHEMRLTDMTDIENVVSRGISNTRRKCELVLAHAVKMVGGLKMKSRAVSDISRVQYSLRLDVASGSISITGYGDDIPELVEMARMCDEIAIDK